MGLWPTERALNLWIQRKWTPKAEIRLQLISKWFFIVIFDLREDRDKNFAQRPYFYNSTRLYMRFWREIFTPKKEDFTRVLVWVHLYSLATNFWAPSVLKGIGDHLNEYIKMSKGAKTRNYVSYTQICVYINVFSARRNQINFQGWSLAAKYRIWTYTIPIYKVSWAWASFLRLSNE